MGSNFSWEQGFNNPLVLGKIAACRKIGKDARISFDAADYHFWLPVLESAVRASEKVGQLKHRCVEQALNDAVLTLKDCDAFLRRCDKAFTQLSSRAKTDFVMVSSVTYTGLRLFSGMKDGDVRLQWQPSQKSNFMRGVRQSRDDLSDVLRSHKISQASEGLTNVLAHVSAFDAHEAHAVATDSIDTLRGMLNLFVNSKRGVNPFSRMSAPHAVNRFRSGPYRTVHNVDGSIATKTFWYEHRWLHETPTVRFKDGKTKKFNQNLKGWWRKLQDNPLSNHIRSGLLRYCRALDQHDAEAALLGMWGALESLTGTQRDKYEVTVSRTALLFLDKETARQIAHHVRLRRNSSIHAVRTLNQEEADAILIHAETLVSRVLFFCLSEGKRFVDENELFNFLDLTLSEAKLRRTIALSKFSVEYHSRKPIPASE
ncbi:hypothetical protein [Bradyrhizobium sp.]|uniref:hypothetical protein n=1 Tax=Bradyrhizobium sp. TaxID=376 RepID=UPI002725F951|nr:hypothetical protein [Bradyrhizobium sp.]MDO9296616.1 hypothetical protein [Bradyrhizobium sp.]